MRYRWACGTGQYESGLLAKTLDCGLVNFSRVKRGRHSGHRAVTHRLQQQTLSSTAAAAAAA
jgi:hypothetical protein